MKDKRNILIALALAAVCAIIYGQTLGHAFVNYDDERFLTDNPPVQAGLSLQTVRWAFTNHVEEYFMPLSWLSHALDWQLYGPWPGGHHLTNLLLHALNSVLVFWILLRLTGARYPSAIVAALFAVHPLHVESVAWAAERKDVLAMLFWTLSIMAYARYASKPSARRYLLLAACFALALMSKPTAVTLPCVLLLLDYWPLNRVRTTGWRAFTTDALKRLIEKTPLFALALADALATFLFQGRLTNALAVVSEPLVMSLRMANAAYATVFYIVKAIFPSGLSAVYPYPVDGFVAWQIAGAVCLLAAVTVFAFATAKKRPYVIVGWLWFLATLAPTLQVFQRRPFLYARADRYMYCALIGLSIMAVWGTRDLLFAGKLTAKKGPRTAIAALTAIMLAAFTVAAIIQTAYWRDSETLFKHAIAVTGPNATAHTNLGKSYWQQKRVPEAKAEFAAASNIDPASFVAQSNLAQILLSEGHAEEAKDHFLKAVKEAPGDLTIWNGLGQTYLNLRQNEQAIKCFSHVLTIDPDNYTAHNYLGSALFNEGRLDEARDHLLKVLDVRPNDPVPLTNLGMVALRQNKIDEAIAYLSRSVDCGPNTSNLGFLGIAFANKGEPAKARQYLLRSLQLDPNFPPAREALNKLK